jgi:hypothetical protein
MPTDIADLLSLTADDHGNIVDAGLAERVDLAFDQSGASRLHEALRRFAGCSVEARAFARCQDDPTHV